MTWKLITPPAALAVSLELARATARLDAGDADLELEQAIRTYTDEAEHETSRAFITQTRRATLDRFGRAIRLEGAPLQSVEFVKFYDQAGQLQTLHPEDYLVDVESEPGYVVPAPGKAWPTTADRINAVHVQYVCGYGADDSTVPDAIRGYILAKVQEHFLPPDSPRSQHLARLLDRYRVYL